MQVSLAAELPVANKGLESLGSAGWELGTWNNYKGPFPHLQIPYTQPTQYD